MKKIIRKRCQISTEYLMIVSFLTFIILGILGIGFFYSNNIKDSIRETQIKSFAEKTISSAESVFYSGEPSKITIEIYIPEGVSKIEIIEDSIVITFDKSSGQNKVLYKSKVPIQGTIANNAGVKQIAITAQSDHIEIS